MAASDPEETLAASLANDGFAAEADVEIRPMTAAERPKRVIRRVLPNHEKAVI